MSFAGHASTVIRYANLTIACDPMLGNWVRGIHRATAPGLTAEDLQEVDVVVISHRDPDHLHPQTLAALPKTATVIVPRRAAARVSKLGFARILELAVGQSVQHREVDIHSTAARYGDDTDSASYVLRGDGPSVFFCGDGAYFAGFRDIGRKFRPDIAILPIGGYAPRSFRDRHMSPLDAIHALEDLGSRVMIPIRHGAFALSYEQLDDPILWLESLVTERDLTDHVIAMAAGESRLFVPPRVAKTSDSPLPTQPEAMAPTPETQTPDTADEPNQTAAEPAVLDSTTPSTGVVVATVPPETYYPHRDEPSEAHTPAISPSETDAGSATAAL